MPQKIKIFVPERTACNLVTPDETIIEHFIKYNIENPRVTFIESPEAADLIILFQEWSFKLPHYAKTLAADALINKYPSKVYVVNYDSTIGEGFLPGCYVSLKKDYQDTSRFRPCAYPKAYNEFINKQDRDNEVPKYLFSFRGTLHSHPIRKTLFETLETAKNALVIDNTKQFHSHTHAEKRQYIDEIKDSIFVLCPRGTSPNSYRLFETMSLGRCPVIISDDWVETIGPDWGNCSIRISEKDIDSIPSLLEKHRTKGIVMGAKARDEWEKYFSDKPKYQQYLQQIVDLSSTPSKQYESIQTMQQHWKSHAFLSNNKWTLKQKLMRRVNKWL